MKERLLNAVRWFCKQWCKIPRQIRAIGNLIVCVVLFALVGLPMLWTILAQFIPEVAFRYDEHLALIGPSEFLGTIDCSGSDYNKVIIAQDDNAFIIYAFNSEKYEYKQNLLNYVEKRGDFTVIPLPFADISNAGVTEARVLLIDEYPEAVRAEMDLQIVYPFGFSYDGQIYTISDAMHISVQADRYADGCFVFDWSVGIDDGSLEALWKQKNLATFIRYPLHSETRDAFDATVRLYDASGRKILEEKIKLEQLIDIDDGK